MKYIVRDKDTCGGKWRVKGTRLLAHCFVEYAGSNNLRPSELAVEFDLKLNVVKGVFLELAEMIEAGKLK